jgi:hypothetical protein
MMELTITHQIDGFITNACSRISKPLRVLLTADAKRYAAFKGRL